SGHGGASDLAQTASPPTISKDSVREDVEKVIGGAGNDTFRLRLNVVMTIVGGAGNDQITVDPTVTSAVVLDGGPGNDVEVGGAGNDTFAEGTVSNGADDLSGGGGVDTVDYAGRTKPVSVTFDGTANDGEATEHDNVRSDVESTVVRSMVSVGAANTSVVEGTAASPAMTVAHV